MGRRPNALRSLGKNGTGFDGSPRPSVLAFDNNHPLGSGVVGDKTAFAKFVSPANLEAATCFQVYVKNAGIVQKTMSCWKACYVHSDRRFLIEVCAFWANTLDGCTNSH